MRRLVLVLGVFALVLPALAFAGWEPALYQQASYFGPTSQKAGALIDTRTGERADISFQNVSAHAIGEVLAQVGLSCNTQKPPLAHPALPTVATNARSVPPSTAAVPYPSAAASRFKLPVPLRADGSFAMSRSIPMAGLLPVGVALFEIQGRFQSKRASGTLSYVYKLDSPPSFVAQGLPALLVCQSGTVTWHADWHDHTPED